MATSNEPVVWGLRPSLGSAEQWGPGRTPPGQGPHEQLQLVLANRLEQAKKHASVQRLAAHYEEWETALRREAEERIGGFKPLQRFIEASGTAEDWQLLRRVKSQAPAFGGAMKRSASEGTLTAAGEHHHAGAGASGGGAVAGRGPQHHHQQQHRVHLRQDWDAFGGAAAAGMHGATPHATPHEAAAARGEPRRVSADGTGPASPQGASQQQQQQQQYAQRFPRATTAPALHEGSSEPESDGSDEPPGAGRHAPRSPLARPASAAAWSGAAGSPDELGARQLEAVAARLLQQSRAAIQNAQAAVQETAINCSQNLQTLGALFSQGLGSPISGSTADLQAAANGSSGGGDGGRASASGGQLQLVPWLAADRAAAAAGAAAEAAAPWDLIPRYLRLAAADGLGGPSLALVADSGDAGDAAAAGAGGPPAVYRQLAQYFDRLEEDRRRRRRARQGGAYSSLREPGRNVAIVTTASLPWMTGTAVNPLLRAAYLANDGGEGGGGVDGGGGAAGARRHVTLMLPWLNKADQERVFPGAVTFDSPDDQEAFVREWAQKRTGLPCDFAVKFYPGRYAPEKGSILPVGDITQYIPDSEADVAVLEEPEHLNWYHHGRRWTDKFRHVVGVMHTNYLDYARREEGGDVKEALLRHINNWVCRIYCHKVIKLSDAVQPLPRENTMFVHGVSPAFLEVGQRKAAAAAEGEAPFQKGAYFLGKVLWAKGYTELLDRLNEHSARTGQPVKVDVYGSGPDLDAVQEEAARRRLPLQFNGARDHADSSLQDYKVFINPSLSDVVATTTAEALAMGKWVVCAEHPSNAFFTRFPNCLIYRDSSEFTACLEKAMRTDPRPLTPEQLQALTWEAATHRFLDVAELKDPSPLAEQLLDNVLAVAHNALTSVEPFRIAAGAGANTRDAPARVTDYVPSEADVGGLFDDSKRAKRIYGAKGGPPAAPAAAAGGGAAGAVAAAVAAAEAETSRGGAEAEAAAAAERGQQHDQEQLPPSPRRRQKGHRRRGSAGGASELAPVAEQPEPLTQQQQQQQDDPPSAAAEEAPAAAPKRRGWRRLVPMAAQAP